MSCSERDIACRVLTLSLWRLVNALGAAWTRFEHVFDMPWSPVGVPWKSLGVRKEPWIERFKKPASRVLFSCEILADILQVPRKRIEPVLGARKSLAGGLEVTWESTQVTYEVWEAGEGVAGCQRLGYVD